MSQFSLEGALEDGGEGRGSSDETRSVLNAPPFQRNEVRRPGLLLAKCRASAANWRNCTPDCIGGCFGTPSETSPVLGLRRRAGERRTCLRPHRVRETIAPILQRWDRWL